MRLSLNMSLDRLGCIVDERTSHTTGCMLSSGGGEGLVAPCAHASMNGWQVEFMRIVAWRGVKARCLL